MLLEMFWSSNWNFNYQKKTSKFIFKSIFKLAEK